MIRRYTPKEFTELWSDQTRYQIWLEVELCACEALESAGHVPRGTAAAIRAKKLEPDASAIDRIEQKTRHDVIAFLTHVEELAGDPARWLHRGMSCRFDPSLELPEEILNAPEALAPKR